MKRLTPEQIAALPTVPEGFGPPVHGPLKDCTFGKTYDLVIHHPIVDHEWDSTESWAGSSGVLYYSARIGSEVARLNGLDPVPEAPTDTPPLIGTVFRYLGPPANGPYLHTDLVKGDTLVLAGTGKFVFSEEINLHCVRPPAEDRPTDSRSLFVFPLSSWRDHLEIVEASDDPAAPPQRTPHDQWIEEIIDSLQPWQRALVRFLRGNDPAVAPAIMKTPESQQTPSGGSDHRLVRRLGDFDVWHKPCENCGCDPGKTTKNHCWKCGRRVYRDFTDRALKSPPNASRLASADLETPNP